ncbi:hypothetical protein RhiJN_21803 [Ceratobasidium sp. AG-Ba]|nr:hypothetical protein RhiJN_21803 [Ceratobasidium sp. AG-Ba]
MEAKLKALKVPELKELLTKSGTPIPSKANKADLIAKILDTPDALKLVDGGSAPAEAPKTADDDLLAPPDEFDWDGGADSSKATAAPAEAATTEAAPAETADTTESAPAEAAPEAETSNAQTAESSTKTPEELEIERRKARAARFGIPYVENPKAGTGPRSKGKSSGGVAEGGKKGGDSGKTNNAGGGGNKKTDDAPKALRISSKEAAPNDDDAKLAARAARFGISGAGASASGSADPAEEEKRKKREARFGESNAKKPKTDA